MTPVHQRSEEAVESHGAKERPCIGFGEFDRRCKKMAGPNPHWCPRCDALRMAYLDGQFKKIDALLKVTAQ